MKKVSIWMFLAVLLVGCSQVKETIETQSTSDASSNDSFDDTFYPIINLNINTSRDDYYNDFYKSKDFQTIGRELEVLSTSHFSTDDYYMAEGQQLSLATVQSDLLKWKSDDVPYSLQPKKDDNVGGNTNVIMTSSIYELDFYQKSGDTYALKGMSFGIVLDPNTKPDNSGVVNLTTPLSEEYLSTYGRQVIDTFYKYIQNNKTFKESRGLPITIAVYSATNTEESTTNGKYILSTHCNGSLGTIDTIDYKNVIFTSQQAEKEDATTSAEFAQFKSLLKKNATEAVGVVGYGRYDDGDITNLTIKIHMNVKTYVEMQYLIAITAEDLNSRFSKPVNISVLLYSQDELEALIIKERGEDAKSIMVNY